MWSRALYGQELGKGFHRKGAAWLSLGQLYGFWESQAGLLFVLGSSPNLVSSGSSPFAGFGLLCLLSRYQSSHSRALVV